MKEVRKRTANAKPGTTYWTVALAYGEELEKAGKIAIKPKSFARRIADKLKRADGIVPTSPHRGAHALRQIRRHLYMTVYWLDEYERVTRRSTKQPKGPEIPPWIGDLMDMLRELASHVKSDT